MKRAVCLHGHFYQPPRENPWIEEVEVQDSAAPFHDWNERITAECYGPNGAARLKSGEGRIRDFRHRFRRDPEGMWLPETAADLRTLEALHDEGIRFTVLSPYQCRRVRPAGGEWVDAAGARFDPTRPCVVRLSSGVAFPVFFYDGPIARAVAFGEALG